MVFLPPDEEQIRQPGFWEEMRSRFFSRQKVNETPLVLKRTVQPVYDVRPFFTSINNEEGGEGGDIDNLAGKPFTYYVLEDSYDASAAVDYTASNRAAAIGNYTLQSGTTSGDVLDQVTGNWNYHEEEFLPQNAELNDLLGGEVDALDGKVLLDAIGCYAYTSNNRVSPQDFDKMTITRLYPGEADTTIDGDVGIHVSDPERVLFPAAQGIRMYSKSSYGFVTAQHQNPYGFDQPFIGERVTYARLGRPLPLKNYAPTGSHFRPLVMAIACGGNKPAQNVRYYKAYAVVRVYNDKVFDGNPWSA